MSSPDPDGDELLDRRWCRLPCSSDRGEQAVELVVVLGELTRWPARRTRGRGASRSALDRRWRRQTRRAGRRPWAPPLHRSDGRITVRARCRSAPSSSGWSPMVLPRKAVRSRSICLQSSGAGTSCPRPCRPARRLPVARMRHRRPGRRRVRPRASRGSSSRVAAPEPGAGRRDHGLLVAAAPHPARSRRRRFPSSCLADHDPIERRQGPVAG